MRIACRMAILETAAWDDNPLVPAPPDLPEFHPPTAPACEATIAMEINDNGHVLRTTSNGWIICGRCRKRTKQANQAWTQSMCRANGIGKRKLATSLAERHIETKTARPDHQSADTDVGIDSGSVAVGIECNASADSAVGISVVSEGIERDKSAPSDG